MKFSLALVSALATTATAINHPDTVVTVIKRLTTTVHAPLAPRQDSDEERCDSAASSIVSGWSDDPPPSAELSMLSALETYVSANDIDTATIAVECGGIDITGSLSAPYSSWSSSYSEWFDEHSTELQELFSACTGVERVSSAMISLLTGCTEVLEPTVSDNGVGPRETGVAMAVAAGFAGMVMAM
ncbi:hypothetical protein S40285_02942 [Stachybotrys chlorohalonatus IBT 40285]|uniref:Infection structure specific protein n=1 Tax=Stachybotrys chlorohalonatus (strain IBT 40285) TaxID=1283841 RepID=A0A084QK57_STAC4|nr:hypothetical protein S40285_02942 [Stachybotrys chlorohalonata IBT 40285]